MKKVHVAIVIATVLVLLTFGNAQTTRSAPLANGGAVGRFQIVVAEHQVLTNEPVIAKSVFRIDTVTGQTSVYSCCTGTKGGFDERWRPVADK
jgi:hypothetical protein